MVSSTPRGYRAPESREGKMRRACHSVRGQGEAGPDLFAGAVAVATPLVTDGLDEEQAASTGRGRRRPAYLGLAFRVVGHPDPQMVVVDLDLEGDLVALRLDCVGHQFADDQGGVAEYRTATLRHVGAEVVDAPGPSAPRGLR